MCIRDSIQTADREVTFFLELDHEGKPDPELVAMVGELEIGSKVIAVAIGETLVDISDDSVNPEQPEDFVGILVEVIDDLVVIDSEEEGRAIRFYILKDETGAPDPDVLAMLKEIEIGSEVIVVAEGETLVHIEPIDTEVPVSIRTCYRKRRKLASHYTRWRGSS